MKLINGLNVWNPNFCISVLSLAVAENLALPSNVSEKLHAKKTLEITCNGKAERMIEAAMHSIKILNTSFAAKLQKIWPL